LRRRAALGGIGCRFGLKSSYPASTGIALCTLSAADNKHYVAFEHPPLPIYL